MEPGLGEILGSRLGFRGRGYGSGCRIRDLAGLGKVALESNCGGLRILEVLSSADGTD